MKKSIIFFIANLIIISAFAQNSNVNKANAYIDQGKLAGGQWLAVHGCGGVGLSAIMIAKALDAQVIAVDIDDKKLAFARDIAADITLNAATIDSVPETIREFTRGGAHVSIDALGSTITFTNSIKCLRKRGKHIQVGLMAGIDETPSIPMGAVIADELEVIGSHGMQAHRYPQLLEMILAGKLAPDKLVGECISLEQATVALTEMNKFSNIGVTVIDKF